MAGKFLNDRDRVELILPSILLIRITEGFQDYDIQAGRKEAANALNGVLACFLEEVRAAVTGVSGDRAKKLVRRAERVEKDILGPFEENTLAGVYFGAVKLLQTLAEEEILTIGDGPFRQGYEALAAAIERSPECVALLGDVEQSATKMARRMLERLRTHHALYRPAPGAVAA